MTLLNIISRDWSTVGLYLVGGLGLSAVLKVVKHVAGSKFGHIVMICLTGLLSALSAFVYWLIKNPVHGGVHFTTQDAAYIMTAATFAYHILVNPTYEKKILPFLTDLATLKANKATVVTPTVAPVTEPPVDGFVA